MDRIINEVGRWSLYLHRESRGLPAAEPWDPAPLKIADEVFEVLYSGEAGALPETRRDRHFSDWAEAIHSACRALPAFGRLAAEVRGDALAAALATETLLDELRPDEPAKPEPQLRRALTTGCTRASGRVEELRDVTDGLSGLGFGSSPGSSTPADGDACRKLASRLLQDDRLKRIGSLAGRFKRIAAAKRRQKVKHGADEVADIEQGGDIARMLPIELAKLRHPRLRPLILRDLMERKALQYRLSGSERLGKGPMICCIDKSGSMEDGEKDIFATAVALALMEIAQLERRPFGLICFDDGVRFEALVRPGEALPAEALFVRPSGGTDIAGAVARGLQLIAENPGQMRKADVVIITDGASATDAAAELRAQAEQLGVAVLGVGIDVAPDALTPWCDEIEVVHSTDELDSKTAEMLFAR